MTISEKVIGIGVVIFMAGCAPVQRYRPAPISPPETAASFEARTLAGSPT